MFWMFHNDKPWFAAKSYGLGAGLPIAWQGWLLLGLHVALIVGLGILIGDRPAIFIPLAIFAAIAPLPIYAAKTKGGWRWRWGGDE